MSKTTTYVIIPNWNGRDIIGACLDSLLKQTEPLKIVVVENGSTDGSAEFIKQRYKQVVLLEFPDNAGFAGGVNRGIRWALDQGAEHILLFNNDAAADKNWAKQLVQAARQYPEAGIVTGKLLRDDKRHIDSTGDFYTIWGLPYPRGRNQPDEGQYDIAEEVFGASGGASLYRSALLREIGLFDEDYFAYYEDVDISFRAQMAGWKVRYQPDAIAYHQVSATSSKLGDFARYHSAKNFMLLYARNMPLRLYVKYGLLFSLQLGRMALTSIARRKFRIFLKGTFAAFRLHGSNVRVRRQTQRSRRVSVSYIDTILTHSRPPHIPSVSGRKQH